MLHNLTIIDFLFLPIILFIGIITSIEDLRTGKIRNKWIVFGFLYWFVVFSIFFIWNLGFDFIFQYFDTHYRSVSLIKFEYSYLFSVITNGFVTMFFVFVLWEYGVIAAGDAKLFWLFSLLIPFTYYWKSYLPFFPSVVLFVNTFFIIAFYLLFISTLSCLRDNRGGYIKSIKTKIAQTKKQYKNGELRHKEFIGQMLVFIAVMITFKLVLSYFSIEIANLPAYIIVSLFFFRRYLRKFLIKTNITNYISVYLLILFFYGLTVDPVFLLITIQKTTIYLLVFIVFLSLIDSLIKGHIKKTSTETINSESLNPRMMIDREFIRRLQADKKFFDQKIGKIYSNSLTLSQVENIKKWCKRNNVPSIEIFKPFRLAFWIFLGVIATLLYQGSLIKMIIN